MWGWRKIKAKSYSSNHSTIKSYLKSLDPFQLHLHFICVLPFNNASMLSEEVHFFLETWSHHFSVKYIEHHVLANSRCLWSPRSLLFALAVVNMELLRSCYCPHSRCVSRFVCDFWGCTLSVVSFSWFQFCKLGPHLHFSNDSPWCNFQKPCFIILTCLLSLDWIRHSSKREPVNFTGKLPFAFKCPLFDFILLRINWLSPTPPTNFTA